MYFGKLFLLIVLSIPFLGCQECLNDPCVRNDFGIHGGRSDAVGNRTGNKVTELTATGPCTLNTHKYGCVLTEGCDNVAVTGTGTGTCHLEGHATVTGTFSVDVAYRSCRLQCGGNAVFVTDHDGLYLSDGSSSDAGIDTPDGT